MHKLVLAFALTTLLAAVVLFAALSGPQVGDLKLLAPHHGYLGLVLAAAALVMLRRRRWHALPGRWLRVVATIGLLFLADDAYQHARQRWNHELEYRSPGHRLLRAVWWIPAVRSVYRWMDGLS